MPDNEPESRDHIVTGDSIECRPGTGEPPRVIIPPGTKCVSPDDYLYHIPGLNHADESIVADPATAPTERSNLRPSWWRRLRCWWSGHRVNARTSRGDDGELVVECDTDCKRCGRRLRTEILDAFNPRR